MSILRPEDMPEVEEPVVETEFSDEVSKGEEGEE